MRVVDRLTQREATWRELDLLLRRMEDPVRRRRKRPGPQEVVWVDEPAVQAHELPRTRAEEVIRLGELYRAACADLMLAEAHDLPRETVAYLHALVARAHNAVYRAQGFKFTRWAGELFDAVPRRLRADVTLRLSALVFFGSFLVFGLLAAGRPGFAETIVGESTLETFERMYEAPLTAQGRNDSLMAGFYIQHNASIGLRCYAYGLAFGLGTLFTLFSNALTIGVVFGYMARTPHALNFYTFVTSHAPFELTAIVFAGAAGLRLGWGAIEAAGQRSIAPLRREAAGTLPTIGAAVFLFILAAFLEGFVSASPLPYIAKATIALASAALLLAYLCLGGRRPVRGRDGVGMGHG